MSGVSPITLEIACRDQAWHEGLPDCDATIRRSIDAVVHHPGVAGSPRGEISIVLAGDTFVRDLNRRYRGKDRPTNVLSFPAAAGGNGLADQDVILGDIVLAFETLMGEASAQGKAPGDHLAHLVVHGVLHLLGYDHQSQSDAQTMELLEKSILSTIGVPDPYGPDVENEKAARGHG